MAYKVYVLAIGVININTGKTKYDWGIYEWKNSTACLTNRGFLLFDAQKSFQIGDNVVLYGNDSQRKLTRCVTIVDTCVCEKEQLLDMLKKNGFDYYPIRPFHARAKNNRKLSTSYSVKGVTYL